MPLLSVVIPTYNAGHYLDAAISSVRQQGVKDSQLIVVNDGSTDNTAALLCAYGTDIIALHQENSGPAAARNAGVGIASGQYLAFLDADDTWPAGRLERQLQVMETNPATDIVQGQIQEFRISDGELQLSGGPYFANTMGSALFRKSVFDRIGPLDEALLYCEDLDWFFAAQAGGVGIHREERVSQFYRRHSENLTNRKDLVRRYTLRVVAKHKQKRSPTPL
jgi:glycosyltransferase involved in cell wall biosynthesis